MVELKFNILNKFAERIESEYGAKMNEFYRIINYCIVKIRSNWVNLQSEFAERIDNNMERIWANLIIYYIKKIALVGRIWSNFRRSLKVLI